VFRRRLSAGVVAPLKIASGCDRRCSFCAIPSFRGAFVSLVRVQEGLRGRTIYTVTARIDGEERAFTSDHAAEAYGEALLDLIESVS
jgi:hypothetical protein